MYQNLSFTIHFACPDVRILCKEKKLHVQQAIFAKYQENMLYRS